MCVWPGWCARRTQGLYWFGQNVPTSSLLLLVLPALSVVGVTYGRERERIPGLWYIWAREGVDPRYLAEGLKSAESLFSCSAVCSCLPLCCVVLYSPFYRRRERCRLHQKKREGENRGEEALWDRRVLLLLHADPTDAVDSDGDGSTSGSCSPLVLCLDAISCSWRSIPSRRTVW